VTKLVWYLFSGGGAVVVTFAAALWVLARPSSRLARRALFIAAFGYTLASVHVIGHRLDRLLVAGFKPFSASDVPRGRTALVVLGSGSFTATDWNGTRFSMPDGAAALRVLETARVFRLTNADWVISSGGLVDPRDQDDPSGLTMRDALVRLGVPAERIIVEIESRNTHDEAVVVAAILAKLGAEHTVLVTSDVHMRRSLGTFRAQGVDAIPAIARHRQDTEMWLGRFIPSEAGLDETGAVAHEILGLAYYAVRGWYRLSSPGQRENPDEGP
jgi:uncharacterized SAM-binding protein YcdF (DUF218 family)